MDLYHITLFIHVVTLLIAAGATAIIKLAIGRRARARTVGEVLDWHTVAMSTSKVFPICLAIFVITGSYMVSVAQLNVWSAGFVVGGLVGVVLLLVSGVFLATKGKSLMQLLETAAKQGADRPAPELVPPRLVAGLPMINTGIVLGVVFDMVTKPASIPIALAVLVIGILLGAAAALRRPASVAKRINPPDSEPTASLHRYRIDHSKGKAFPFEQTDRTPLH